jgi:hypothetical protein
VAIEIGRGANGQTRFDLWIVCEETLTFASFLDHTVLQAFRFSDDTEAFKNGELLTSCIDDTKLLTVILYSSRCSNLHERARPLPRPVRAPDVLW